MLGTLINDLAACQDKKTNVENDSEAVTLDTNPLKTGTWTKWEEVAFSRYRLVW